MTFLRLGLSHKIFAIGVVGVVGVFAAGAIYFVGAARQSHYEQIADAGAAINSLAQSLDSQLLDARRAEKDFLLRKDEKSIARHAELSKEIGARLADIKRRVEAAGQTGIGQRIVAIDGGLAKYGTNFNALVDAKRKLGLTPTAGLEGTLRTSVHAIEQKLSELNDPLLTVQMLSMRRHEKDFMLRHDPKYVGELTQSAAAFTKQLAASPVPPAVRADITDKLAAYQRDFTSWVEGSNVEKAAASAMSAAYAAIEPQIESFIADIAKSNAEAQRNREEIRASTQQNMIVAILAIGLAAMVLAFLIGRAVVKPLNAMTSAMKDLAGGDLKIDIPGMGRHDEIGDMASAVEVFKLNAIERLRLEAEQKEAELRAAAERKALVLKLANDFESAVGVIVHTVSSASTELEAAAGTLTGAARNTQQLSGRVAASSEQASANVQAVSAATEELAGSVAEISRQVQESSRIAHDAVQQTVRTDTRISELSQAAGRIGDVIKLITAIAEQTNLLALNATIEAARAGEAGRGFAVVASEVKALATQTAKATEEIGTQIAGMQAATQDAVASIREISGTITRVSEISTTIAAAVEEQGAATGEIARNVQQAAQGTSEVASSIGEVNEGAGETGSASAQVLASAQSLAQESTQLKVEVDKFLITVRAA